MWSAGDCPIRCRKCRFKLCSICYERSCWWGGVHERNEPQRPPPILTNGEKGLKTNKKRMKKKEAKAWKSLNYWRRKMKEEEPEVEEEDGEIKEEKEGSD